MTYRGTRPKNTYPHTSMHFCSFESKDLEWKVFRHLSEQMATRELYIFIVSFICIISILGRVSIFEQL